MNGLYCCLLFPLSTGIWVPNIPEDINGIEHTVVSVPCPHGECN